MSAEIIKVDFKTGKRIDTEKYVITTLICNVCRNFVKTDSRKKNNPQYIALDNWKKENACICKDCAIDIRDLCEENNWK